MHGAGTQTAKGPALAVTAAVVYGAEMGETRASGDRAIFEGFLFDMIAGRYEEIAPKLAVDVVWHLPPFAKQPPMEGREAVLRFLQEAAAAFYQEGSMRLEPVAFTAEDGFASCLATLRATTRHGRPYENRYGFFTRLHEGLLIEVWEILDSVVLLEQTRNPGDA